MGPLRGSRGSETTDGLVRVLACGSWLVSEYLVGKVRDLVLSCGNVKLISDLWSGILGGKPHLKTNKTFFPILPPVKRKISTLPYNFPLPHKIKYTRFKIITNNFK